MAIYRGPGGAGDATGDATNASALALAAKDAAQASATSAASSATAASTSATEAASSATDAATSATNAAGSATTASTAATNASNSASDAADSATEAASSASDAADSATAAASSASSASTSASTASTQATNAASSASSASTSASTATTKASEATTSATNAASSASLASTSASTATTKASEASTSATNAASSASSASTSASTATTKASEASTSATNAASSASSASTSASSASSSASAASTSATNAASSATSAASSATSAASSAASAAASLDSFDDRYLGSKTSNPTLDNDGNALVTGALYYNSVANEMRVYDGSQWIAASAASQAILTKYKYVATAGQTTFSGSDANSLTLAYTVGSIIVTLNGVVLNGADYTATTGTSVVLAVAAALNDELNVLSFSTFDVANTYTQSQVDATFLTKSNPNYTGTLTGGTGVVNLGSGQFYKDASGNVGIGTSSPSATLTVVGSQIIHKYTGSVSNTTFGQYNSSGDTSINVQGSANLLFATANTERARIDTSGNLLVGKTASDYTTKGARIIGSQGVYSAAYSAGDYSLFNCLGTSGTNYAMAFWQNGGTEVGSIRTTNSATSYVTSSDYRLKENIQPMQGALATLAQLKPCTYSWKADGTDGQGFIAHELQEVVPDAVVGEKDAVNEDGSIKPQGIDTSFLVATLTAAIQEQQAMITSQSEQLSSQAAVITTLTERITALENK